MSQDVIQLTIEQAEVTVPALAKIKAKQNEINEIIGTLQPVVTMFCKMNNVNPEEYVLSEDGRALISRSALMRAQQPAGSPIAVPEPPAEISKPKGKKAN